MSTGTPCQDELGTASTGVRRSILVASCASLAVWFSIIASFFANMIFLVAGARGGACAAPCARRSVIENTLECSHLFVSGTLGQTAKNCSEAGALYYARYFYQEGGGCVISAISQA